MVSLTGHILPLLAVIAVWFVSTGLVAWLGHRPRETFARSLSLSGVVGLCGLAAILLTRDTTTIAAAYASFFGALAIWGWLEMAFLMGAITGPRRQPSSGRSRGWHRFTEAARVLIHHELALAATAILLLSLSWGTANPTGAIAFLLLFGMRLSTKLNIFAGVPNMNTDLLPPQLAYLKSYFGPRRFTLLLPVSLAAVIALTAWLGARAFAAPADSFAAASASLIFGFAALGALEHLFLALPFRDGALWRWAMPKRTKRIRT